MDEMIYIRNARNQSLQLARWHTSRVFSAGNYYHSTQTNPFSTGQHLACKKTLGTSLH
jgi:hypothetical protein